MPTQRTTRQNRRLSYYTAFPQFLYRKISKTGQTRGADDDSIYQNRVNRNSTVLIPFAFYEQARDSGMVNQFENGYIVIASPGEYVSNPRLPSGLELGRNLLVFFRRRSDWTNHGALTRNWSTPNSRTPVAGQNPPLGGHYIARVPATTADDDERGEAVFRGFLERGSQKGAGIRFFEYCSAQELERTRYQLSYLAWKCEGMLDFVLSQEGTSQETARAAVEHVTQYCNDNGLSDERRLQEVRLLKDGFCVCPLCLEKITPQELVSHVEQVEGREVTDLTVTAANLFHVQELLPGHYNHKTYNLGWGHHHCNTVTRDHGVFETIDWMKTVLRNNGVTRL